MPLSGPIVASLSAEYRLLLCSARLGLHPQAEESLQALLRREINWESFVRLLQWYRLVPPVCARLRCLGPDAIPAPMQRTLQAHAQHNTQRNLVLASELVRLVQLLQEHGIRVLPLKGPALAIHAYGNLALRHAGDLDLLVPRQALRQTRQILQELGYSCLQERLGTFNSVQEAAYLKYNNELSFWYEARGIHIDLHWGLERLRQRFLPDSEPIWDRLTSVAVAGTAVPWLADEDRSPSPV